MSIILSSFVFIHEGSDFPGVLIAFPCIGAALVILGHGGRWASALSAAPMVWIGGLSYSLYLWHWPVFAFVRYGIGRYEMAPPLLVLTMLVITGLSYASLRFVETPFRERGWFVGMRFRKTFLLALGVFAPILFSQRVNSAVEMPLPVSQTRYADPLKICLGRVVDDCIRGAVASDSPPVLVLGDSHAAQLNLFFDRLGESKGKQFRVITASSCVTIPGFDVERLPDWAQSDCHASIDFARQFIPESPEIVIAAMWQYQLQSKEFIQALNRFLATSQAAGKRIKILWQVPMLTSDVQRLRRLERLGFEGRMRVHDEWRSANQHIAGIAAQYSNVQFLEFSGEDFFLSPPFYRGSLIYHDSHHLNELGALLYADLAKDWF